MQHPGTTPTIPTTTAAWARAAVAVVGGSYVLTAVALLFAPRIFFEVIAPFPPFNRHFLGDIGAFLLPIGIGLLYAARWPRRYRLGLILGVSASVVHALNHLYDDLLVRASVQHLLSDALPIVATALLLAWATRVLTSEGRAR